MNGRHYRAKRMCLRAWLGALLLFVAQAAMAAHAVENDHGFNGFGDEPCLACLHGDRHDGALLPDAVPACGPAHLSTLDFPLPQDRQPVRAFPRAHPARAPPLHSSAA